MRRPKTERPEGWPRLLRDWPGLRLRSVQDLRSGMALLPAGTMFTVERAGGGIAVVSDACPCCGVRIFFTRCQPSSFELLP